MPLNIAEKLKIRENSTLLTVNAPKNFEKGLGELPKGVKIVTAGSNYHQIHWFVMNKVQVEKEMAKVLKLLKDDIMLWIYYPKGSSGIQTDLTRDKGWEKLLSKGDHLTWINLISFDDTWSVFGCRMKNEKDKKKETVPRQREILNWIDPIAKTMTLPEDLQSALKKDKNAKSFFDSLSFSNRKEYLEWIVTAKREETRVERINGTIDRLNKKWKNPRNI